MSFYKNLQEFFQEFSNHDLSQPYNLKETLHYQRFLISFNLSSIQDQAELSSSIRLEMARKNVQEGQEFSLQIIYFLRNGALP